MRVLLTGGVIATLVGASGMFSGFGWHEGLRRLRRPWDMSGIRRYRQWYLAASCHVYVVVGYVCLVLGAAVWLVRAV